MVENAQQLPRFSHLSRFMVQCTTMEKKQAATHKGTATTKLEFTS